MTQPSDAFHNKFYLISHDCFSKNNIYNFKEPKFVIKITIFAISSRGSRFWNKILDNDTKAFKRSSFF